MKMPEPLGKIVGPFLKLKHKTALWPSNSTPRHIPRKLEPVFKENVYMNMHCSLIHNSRTMETTPMSICWWMGHSVGWPHEGILFTQEKGWGTDIHHSRHGPWKYPMWKKANIEGHIPHNSIYMGFQKRQIQEVFSRVWGERGTGVSAYWVHGFLWG